MAGGVIGELIADNGRQRIWSGWERMEDTMYEMVGGKIGELK
jgi:hypothetical protein